MPLDGLTLKVLIDELQNNLRNGRVTKIYQPSEFTLTLQLKLPGKTETLLLSADPMHPRIHTILEQPTNPLNPPAFCMLLRKYLEPSRLLNIIQKGWDRQIHLQFECPDERGQLTEKTLVFELMGRHSNIFLLDKGEIILDALKRYPDSGAAPGFTYQAPSDQGKIDPTAVNEGQFLNEVRLLPPATPLWRWVMGYFQGFSKVAAQEVVKRAGFTNKTTRQDLKEADWYKLYQAFEDLLAELKLGGNPKWYPTQRDFTAYTLTDLDGEKFANTNDLIRDVLSERVQTRKIEGIANELRRQVNTHYKRVLRKESIQKNTLQEVENTEIWRHQGELLTAHFHLIPTGKPFVAVPDYTLPDQPLVEIELDPRLSPSANVQRIFKRYNKAKISKKVTAQQLQKTKAERRYLEDILSQIELADEQGILQAIENELIAQGYLKSKKPKRRNKKEPKQGPDRYLSPDGLTILVGRNNHQNDELTFRLSSPKSLWLHAKDVPGSHVIILEDREIPDDTLLQAALLAAYFSQNRNSTKVEVDYTLRRNVKKPRGAKPGFVYYEQFKTIMVDPTQFILPPKI